MKNRKKNLSVRNTTEMIRYGSNMTFCRRKMILEYFGEEFEEKNCFEKCDNCLVKKVDNELFFYEEINCRKIIYDLEGILKISTFFRKKPTLIQLSKFLLGKSKIEKRKKPPLYFKEYSEEEIRYILRELIYNEILKENFKMYKQGTSSIGLGIEYRNYNIFKNNENIEIIIRRKINKDKKEKVNKIKKNKIDNKQKQKIEKNLILYDNFGFAIEKGIYSQFLEDENINEEFEELINKKERAKKYNKKLR